MSIAFLDSLDDPRLDSYRSLKKTNETRWRNEFIVEGETLVERMVDSAWPILSVLVASDRAAKWQARLPVEVPLYVLPAELIRALVGYSFHRGVLACGQRPAALGVDELDFRLRGKEQGAERGPRDPRGSESSERPSREGPSEAARRAERGPRDPRGSESSERPSREGPSEAARSPAVVAVGIDIHDPVNVGAILRTSRTLGLDAVLLSSHCAEPFSRRVLRTSMGAPFDLPMAILGEDIIKSLDNFRAQYGFTLAATVVDANATPVDRFKVPRRLAVLFGSEGKGLEPEVLGRCDHRITIPMAGAADSLNVAVAAGIVLWEIRRGAGGNT